MTNDQAVTGASVGLTDEAVTERTDDQAACPWCLDGSGEWVDSEGGHADRYACPECEAEFVLMYELTGATLTKEGAPEKLAKVEPVRPKPDVLAEAAVVAVGALRRALAMGVECRSELSQLTAALNARGEG